MYIWQHFSIRPMWLVHSVVYSFQVNKWTCATEMFAFMLTYWTMRFVHNAFIQTTKSKPKPSFFCQKSTKTYRHRKFRNTNNATYKPSKLSHTDQVFSLWSHFKCPCIVARMVNTLVNTQTDSWFNSHCCILVGIGKYAKIGLEI